MSPCLAFLDSRAATELDSICSREGVTSFRLNANATKFDFDRDIISSCNGANLDLLCLTFDRIVPAELIESMPNRVINVHPGLLPAYKGLNALVRAASDDVRFAGATIHEVVEQVDSGPIISQCVIGLRSGESADSIGNRIYQPLCLMFLQVIRWYRDGRIFSDVNGRLRVRGATYGELPISPSIDPGFGDGLSLTPIES